MLDICGMRKKEIVHNPKNWHCKCKRCVRLGEEVDRCWAEADDMDKKYVEMKQYSDQYEVAEWCEMNDYTPRKE